MGNDAAIKISKGGVKVKMIKVFNDFLLGVMMMGVSLYLLIGEIATNIPKTSQGGYLSRADVWIKMLAIMLLLVSIILVFKSINFKKGETKKFEFFLDGAIVSTIIGLIARPSSMNSRLAGLWASDGSRLPLDDHLFLHTFLRQPNNTLMYIHKEDNLFGVGAKPCEPCQLS